MTPQSLGGHFLLVYVCCCDMQVVNLISLFPGYCVSLNASLQQVPQAAHVAFQRLLMGRVVRVLQFL